MVERDVFQKFAEKNTRDFPANPLFGYYRLPRIWEAKPVFSGEISEFNETQSGIIISNHPSSFDLAFISELIQFRPDKLKNDFKVLVTESSYNFYSSYFEKDNFIVSSTKPREILSIFSKLTDWINGGGLFVMFPTKRNENKECENLQFETGFSFLLKNIDPNKPILSVSINPQNILQINKNTSLFKLNVNVLLWSLIKKEFKAKSMVNVFIKHSLAKDWLKMIDLSLNNQEKNLKLMNKYKEIHGFNLINTG